MYNKLTTQTTRKCKVPKLSPFANSYKCLYKYQTIFHRLWYYVKFKPNVFHKSLI